MGVHGWDPEPGPGPNSATVLYNTGQTYSQVGALISTHDKESPTLLKVVIGLVYYTFCTSLLGCHQGHYYPRYS